MSAQSDIPSSYYQLTLEEMNQRVVEVKKKLGDDLLILAHHYQQDNTFRFCDVSGDSLYLARQAAKTPAKYIVFCGVHFMAESSDILTGDEQVTILPELTAGCSMADMADTEAVENCWKNLMEVCGENSVVPITYINSPASLKAFCAKYEGTVCTSSNSSKILQWALDQNKRVLFFPDQHLGRNTANALGISPDQISLWNRDMADGGLPPEEIRNARVILWNGCCSVHCGFTVSRIEEVRKRRPGIKVIVHPECPEDIVKAADYSGSTDMIIKTVTEADPSTEWSVGTEVNMVERLANNLAAKQGKYVESLNGDVCICSSMNSVHPANVLWVLDNLLEGRIVNRITVPQETKGLAKRALERMLELSG
ncbi:MAG: quinolinate synthase NadA [Proteobacteria bacterium]|nr:quinolinate synthase NadA [Pseudomonadota bacterium]